MGTLWPSLLAAGFRQERKQSWSWVGRVKAHTPLSPEALAGLDDGAGGEPAGWGGGRVLLAEKPQDRS